MYTLKKTETNFIMKHYYSITNTGVKANMNLKEECKHWMHFNLSWHRNIF